MTTLSLVQGIEELEELKAPLGPPGDTDDVLLGVGLGLGGMAIVALAYDAAVIAGLIAVT